MYKVISYVICSFLILYNVKFIKKYHFFGINHQERNVNRHYYIVQYVTNNYEKWFNGISCYYNTFGKYNRINI